MKKAIVIGSGFGGLAIACRLKKHNFNVKLLEKQSDLGGRARTFTHNGFKYDAGPTVITAPYLINELYSLHDEDPRDYFNLLKVESMIWIQLIGFLSLLRLDLLKTWT